MTVTAILAACVIATGLGGSVMPDPACCRAVTVAVSVAAEPAVKVDAAKVDAEACFEKVKALAGKWAGKTEDGDAVVEFRVTSAGSAVVETMFPGTPHEMVNMYTMDGGDLYMVHYCAMGNQPKMKLVAAEGGVMKFEAVSVANKPDADVPYMNGLELTMSATTLKEKWSNWAKDKPETHEVFEMARQ